MSLYALRNLTRWGAINNLSFCYHNARSYDAFFIGYKYLGVNHNEAQNARAESTKKGERMYLWWSLCTL